MELKDDDFSKEIPIFFETFSDDIVELYAKGALETYAGPSARLTFGRGEVNKSTKYELDPVLNSKVHRSVRSILRKRSSELMKEKVKFIGQIVLDDPELSDPRKAVEPLNKRLAQISQDLVWLSQRFFIPFSKIKGQMHVSVLGIVNDSNEGSSISEPWLYFSRVILNPDPDGKKRKISTVFQTEFNSKLNFQLLQQNEETYELERIQKNSSIVFELCSLRMVQNQMSVEDDGFTVLPLFDAH